MQVYGNVSVFEARGQYQLSVEIVQPRGLGLLQAKFEALKRKLEAEGLFDPARKKRCRNFRSVSELSLPRAGLQSAIFSTSCGGARAEIEILINPVRVQGTGAAAKSPRPLTSFQSKHDLAAYRFNCHRARWRRYRGFVGV